MERNKETPKKPTQTRSALAKDERPIGPYLSAAVIAEEVVLDRGVPTVKRIVDFVGFPNETDMPLNNRIPLRLTILVMFKACGFQGDVKLSIIQTTPSGKQDQLRSQPITFDGNMTSGVSFVAQIVLDWEGPGTYWFDVFLDDKLYGRVPFDAKVVGAQ